MRALMSSGVGKKGNPTAKALGWRTRTGREVPYPLAGCDLIGVARISATARFFRVPDRLTSRAALSAYGFVTLRR